MRFAIIVALVACNSSSTKPKQKLQAGDIALVGATVVPMNREGTLADHTVVVRGDRIALVAPSKSIDTSSAKVVDVNGKWLVPGLADMHVHTWDDRDFGLYLLNGVTTVRDLFGSPQHLEWRSAIASGKRAGPTLLAAGPIVDGDPPVWPGSAVVTSADAARKVVREQKQAGYDFIKVYNGLSVESYNAITEEAKAQGIPVVGHGTKVVAKPKQGTSVELETARDAVIAPQAIAEFVWYGDRLAKLGVGAKQTLTVAEVMTDSGLKLDPASFTFERLSDADGRRMYKLAGKHGQLDATGTFSVDKDGAPHDVSVTVVFGTFGMKRVDF